MQIWDKIYTYTSHFFKWSKYIKEWSCFLFAENFWIRLPKILNLFSSKNINSNFKKSGYIDGFFDSLYIQSWLSFYIKSIFYFTFIVLNLFNIKRSLWQLSIAEPKYEYVCIYIGRKCMIFFFSFFFDPIRSRVMVPLEGAIDVAASSRKRPREYCSPNVSRRTSRCHLIKQPSLRRPQHSAPTRRSLGRLSSQKSQDFNRTKSTMPCKRMVNIFH